MALGNVSVFRLGRSKSKLSLSAVDGLVGICAVLDSDAISSVFDCLSPYRAKGIKE